MLYLLRRVYAWERYFQYLKVKKMSNFFSTLTGKMIAGDGYKSNAMVSVNWLIGFCQLLFGTGVVAGPSTL